MNTILWYQPAILSEKDVIIYNGNPLEEGLGRIEAFNKLKTISEKAIGKERPWHGKIDKYYFIKGSFTAKDERGRNLSFMFISDATDGRKELTEILKVVNKDLTEQTKACLNSSSSIRLKTIIICLIGLCIIAIITLMTKYFNEIL